MVNNILSSLPEGVIVDILSRCYISDIHSFAKVSKQCYNLANSHRLFNRITNNYSWCCLQNIQPTTEFSMIAKKVCVAVSSWQDVSAEEDLTF